jgi:MFS family permease
MSAALQLYRRASILAVQFLTAAAPLAIVPFLSLQVGRLTRGEAAEASIWTAIAAAAPASAAIVSTPLWGRFAQGRSISLLLFSTCALTAASYLAMAVADDAATFAMGRALQGAAGSGIILILAIELSGAHPERGYIDLQQAFSAGCLVGPVLGGWAFDHQRLPVFLYGAAASLLVLAIWCALVFQTTDSDLRQGRDEGADNAPTRTERGRNRRLIVAAVFGTAGAFGFVPFFAEWAASRDAARFDATAIGMLHASAWFAAIVVLPIWNRIIDGAKAARSIAISLLGSSAACAALSASATAPWIFALRVTHGAFHSGLNPALYAGVRRSSERERDLASARTALTLGQILGPASCGAVVPFAGADGALLAAAGLSAIGLLVLFSARGDR